MADFLKPSRLNAVLAIVLFLALAVIVDRVLSGVQVDLTEDGLYTISDSTEHVLEGLDAPVALTLFFSESVARDFPGIFAYGRRIRELLQQYSRIAGDDLRLEVIEPAPFSEAEDRAVAAGLQGIPTGSGEQIFLGLVARDMTDREEVIPFFSQERETLLEYDLTRLIADVSRLEKPVVGLLTALPMHGTPPSQFQPGGEPPWALHEQLNQMFDVADIETDFEALPDDMDVLLLIHPPALEPTQLYAIDQYVMGGGRAAAFIDPFSEFAISEMQQQQMSMRPTAPVKSGLGPLLGAWGLTMAEGHVVGDRTLAQRVSVGAGGPGDVKSYIVWLAARGEAIDAIDPVTADLDQINLASVGSLEIIEESGLTIEPLLRSSAGSGLLETSLLRGFPDPDELQMSLDVDDRRHLLMARVTGAAVSAFPDGPPEDAPQAQRDVAHLGESRSDIAVLVAADSDLIDGRFWVRAQNFLGQRTLMPFADNANLVLNAIEQLSGDAALIALRGRGVRARPFEVVEDIRRQAEERFRAEEQRLQDELAATERRLSELQSQLGEGDVLFTPEQDAEMQRFRERTLEIRQQLREVQRRLVEDIDSLKTRLAFINIALVPLILTAVAIALGVLRRRRRAERAAS